MIYKLQFLPSALKEWKKLASPIQEQLKKKLAERLEWPHVPSARLSGFKNYYKIKLRSSGYRLVYEVMDKKVTVLVIGIDKRNKDQIYKSLQNRKKKQ